MHVFVCKTQVPLHSPWMCCTGLYVLLSLRMLFEWMKRALKMGCSPADRIRFNLSTAIEPASPLFPISASLTAQNLLLPFNQNNQQSSGKVLLQRLSPNETTSSAVFVDSSGTTKLSAKSELKNALLARASQNTLLTELQVRANSFSWTHLFNVIVTLTTHELKCFTNYN